MDPRTHACGRRPSVLLAMTIAAMASLVAVGQAQAPSVGDVVGKMGAYLQDYENKTSELAADEEFKQWIKRLPGYGGEVVGRRQIKSTFFLVRLANGQAWYGFRDVTRVDGKPVPGGRRSMLEVLSERTVDAYDEALAITRANAKYNIGRVYRTVNVPLQALEMLHPKFQSRFTFALAKAERVAGRDAIQVDFAERSAPSLINDGFGGTLLAHGRVWVESATGAVLKTDLRYGSLGFIKESTIQVEYRWDNRLQMLVPAELEESYLLDIEVLHGRASYSNFRRFETGARLVVPK